MDEKFEFPSSQDLGIIPSHEPEDTHMFNIIWNDYTQSLLQNVANNLDSSTIGENNQQLATSIESSVPGDFQSSDHVVSVELPVQSTTIGSNVHQGSSSLPACETWPGDYNFTVSFSPQHKSTKGVAWTYSRIKDKLYVGKDAPCPINISADAKLPSDTFIRVMALYTSPEQVSEIVQRCFNHSTEEFKQGRTEARHLIRCESSTATYDVDAITGRHSVLVPFENPPAGQQYSTYIYKFTCFGSCAGGPNRRPLMLIFTLERNNQVIGRKKLDVKICACPGRDRKNDEEQCMGPEDRARRPINPLKRKLNSEYTALSEALEFTKNVYVPLPKKNKISPSKDGLYHIYTEDRGCYKFLKQMKIFYEICKNMRGVTPDVLSRALQNAQKIKSEKSD